MKPVKLSDVCELKPAKSLAKNMLSDDELVAFSPMEYLPVAQKYFTPTQTKKLSDVYSSYVYFADNDVIYAKITPCFENGKMSIARGLKNGVGFGSSEYVPIRCSDAILPEYLYYFLLQPNFIKNGKDNMRGASGHKRVTDDYVKNLEIMLPSVERQQKVVERLDAAFEKIDKAVELTQETINYQSEAKTSFLGQAFSDKNVNNVKLSDVCEVIAGQSPIGSSYNEQGDGIEFHQGKKLFGDNELKISKVFTSSPSKIALPNDILISVRAPVGPVNYTRRKICIGRGLAAIRCSNEIIPSYLFYYLRMNEALINGKEGATFASINKNDIENLKIPLPSVEVQQKAVERLDETFEKIDKSLKLRQRKLQKLHELKQSLLAEAFNCNGVQ
jgi:type I restriction enzyme S subunit